MLAVLAGIGLASRSHGSTDASARPVASGPATAAPAHPDGVAASASATRAKPSATATPKPERKPKPKPKPDAHPNASAPAAKSAAAQPVSGGGHRTVTFVNHVGQTVWVAGAQQTAQPALPVTGWVLPAGASLTIHVPDKWNGRFWGRTGCTFNAAGQGHCATGDCAGRFQCAQYGALPATLAEFNLNSWDDLDFYDVSMVDGSNLPMWINITSGSTHDPISATGCQSSLGSAGCTRPVACPAALQVPGNACLSPCAMFDTDQYCCRAQWSSRTACDPTKWPVDYAAVFKKAEPFAYSYVDDDATSTFTCSGECGYRITFGLSP